jgi:hypothetical protein
MHSILNTIKKIIGIDESYTHFDTDLIMHINSVFFILNQLGIGPEEPYSITGPDEEWSDFFMGSKESEIVKSYIAMKVRMMFDPPQNNALAQVIKEQISEFEWRANVASGV